MIIIKKYNDQFNNKDFKDEFIEQFIIILKIN